MTTYSVTKSDPLYSATIRSLDLVERSDVEMMIAAAVTKEAKYRRACQWKSAVRKSRRKH